ncbi:MauE/DoxX family redox-associated membrane protein [Pediococcus parvulus]|uniref:MauE/DoxX family redox-associated membrane protein n=1 Tax=Pediococcus parvulus TaxID=54062 RepID=UPI003D0340D2
MTEFMASISGFLIALFISTSVSKVINYKAQLGATQILFKNSTVLQVFFLEILAAMELVTAIMLLINNPRIRRIAFLMTAILFICYSATMLIYLLFKQKSMGDVHCSCGGILGTGLISWKLILRNFIIITISLSIFLFVDSNYFTNFSVLEIFLGIVFAFVYNTLRKILNSL